MKEIQVKTAWSSLLTPVRMTFIKNKNVREDGGEKKPGYVLGGNIISTTTMEISMNVPHSYY
jgi:hypothetical protein